MTRSFRARHHHDFRCHADHDQSYEIAVPLQLGVRSIAFPTLNRLASGSPRLARSSQHLLVVGEFALTGWRHIRPIRASYLLAWVSITPVGAADLGVGGRC
jgi:hypothetical protein